MATYSQYGSNTMVPVIADESYATSADAFRAVEEASMNAHRIFESIITRDFQEAACEHGHIVAEAMEVINENAITDVWQKVVDFFSNILEKIEGFFKNLAAKFQALFVKNDKDIVTKYKKQLYAKLNSGKLKDVKVKWYNKEAIRATDIDDVPFKEISNMISSMKTDNLKIASTFMDGAPNDKEVPDNEKPYTADQKEELVEKYWRVIDKNSDSYDEYKKEVQSTLENDLDEVEITTSIITDMELVLTTGKDTLKKLSNLEKDTTKEINDVIKYAKDIKKKAESHFSDKPGTSNQYNINRSHSLASRIIDAGNIANKVVTQATTCNVDATKKIIKQARANYVKLSTYGHSTVTESTLMTAIEEASDFEVDEMFY